MLEGRAHGSCMRSAMFVGGADIETYVEQFYSHIRLAEIYYVYQHIHSFTVSSVR